MATVVSVRAISRELDTLGWNGLNAIDLVAAAKANGVTAVELSNYLAAAASNPQGYDDQTIVGCSAASATKMTTYFKGQQLVAT